MNQNEKTIDSRSIFEGRIIKVRLDRVSLPDGRESTREVVEHRPAVAIVALDEQHQILLVSQYRKPVEQVLLEIPAGIMEDGETPLSSAKRELAEETGFRADTWEEICAFYTAPGFTDEKTYLFKATDLRGGETDPDADEFIELHKFSLAEAQQLIATGKVMDAKSIIGIQSVLQGRSF